MKTVRALLGVAFALYSEEELPKELRQSVQNEALWALANEWEEGWVRGYLSGIISSRGKLSSDSGYVLAEKCADIVIACGKLMKPQPLPELLLSPELADPYNWAAIDESDQEWAPCN